MDKELSKMFDLIHFIEPGLASEKITEERIIAKGEKFMKSHCSSTVCMFQVKKSAWTQVGTIAWNTLLEC